MCQYDTQLDLCQNQKGYITWCKKCELYSVIYGTCCIAFTKNEFSTFYDVLNKLESPHYIPSQCGKETVFLRSTKCNMGICLTENQAEELKEMFEEAAHTHQVYSIVIQ